MKKSFIYFLLLCQYCLSPLKAQQDTWLKYEIKGDFSKQGEFKYTDSLQLEQFKRETLAELHQLGYLTPVPIIKEHGDGQILWIIFTGGKFEWLKIRRGNVDPVFLIKSGIDLRQFENQAVNYKDVALLFEKILKNSENQGYPFAAIRLDSLRRDQNRFEGALDLDFGPFITFDTLKITGDSRTKRQFLGNFLQIRPGEAFSQKKVVDGIRQVRNLPYLRWAGEPEISFQNEEATLYLPVNDRRINSIDGIIGFLPNELQGGRMLITGQFDLALYNVAGRGRNYELHWQRFNEFSQSLHVSALEPLVLGSGIDIKASFSLLKEDTTFLTRDFKLDFGYRIGSNTYLSLFSRRQAGDLLDVSGLGELNRLPAVGDFRFNSYGAGFEQSWLDDRFFPRRGGLANFEFSIGNKSILINTAIPVELYQGLDLRSLQYYFTGSFEKHFYWNSRWGLFSRLSGGVMENPNLFVNDLFRIGGLRTIRGFNENFFFANNFIFLNVEPRYYFDTYSYFMIFADVGRLDNKVQSLPTDFPYAAGMGFTLETGSVIFNFIYALGGSNTQDFALNLSKIHFGYTGRF
ncbi:hypothetical protein [Cecembia sp.]|uniref:hypothetical protein n=1 Tax=Cecembia sp. TaxID=1898110 RepID=UPI0025B8C66A|nr:hypothetical protein [Cecembia sp.]